MAATLLVVAGCGAAANGDPSAPAVQRIGSLTLPANGKGVSLRLPPHWRITMQAYFPSDRSTLRMQLASSNVRVFDGSHTWHRVELTDQGLLVDGRHSGSSSLAASHVTIRATHGPVEIRALVIRRTARGASGGLLKSGSRTTARLPIGGVEVRPQGPGEAA